MLEIECPIDGCNKMMTRDEMGIGSHLRSHVTKGDIGPKKAQRIRHGIVQADVSSVGRKDNVHLEKQLSDNMGIK